MIPAKQYILRCILFAMVVFCGSAASAEPLRLYLDADMTGARASGVSIERGIRTALDEVDNQMAGRPVELVVLDHRGNTARSLVNLKAFLDDPDALALFTGMHSPPLLKHRDFINQNKILTLDPWAAAGAITRSAGPDNWIFRLSIDDSKAGEVIIRRAVDERGFSRPALLLENTGWGSSNLKTMTASLNERDLTPVNVSRFDWGTTLAGAKIFLRNIRKTGADVIFLVANASEAKVFCQAMCELKPENRLPIVSHWGITGGDFPRHMLQPMRNKIDLEFLQTSFSFMNMGDAPFPGLVFQRAAALFPDIREPADITAPTGFIHAYDLTRILLAAVSQSGLTGDMGKDRAAVRSALERLELPVRGLVKTYAPPFRPYSQDDPDAHEALGAENYTFGRYDDDDAIILVR